MQQRLGIDASLVLFRQKACCVHQTAFGSCLFHPNASKWHPERAVQLIAIAPTPRRTLKEGKKNST